MLMKRLTVILFLFSVSVALFAQQGGTKRNTDPECAVQIKEADIFYQNGLFIDCINKLENMLASCQLSKSDKIHALELLAKSYIETGEPGKAESAVNLILVNNPHYEIKETDNSESYIRMVKKYKVHPLLSIAAKNTANWLRRPTTKVFSVLEGLDYSQPLIEEGYWFTYYGNAEFEFVDGISINADLMTFWTRYGRDFYEEPGFSLSYWERDCFVEFPFYIKKYFHAGKNILIYGSGGLGVLFLTSAIGNATISYTKDDIITGKDADYSSALYNLDTKDLRTRITGHWNAGIGIGYKLKNLRMFVDTRYLGGLGSFTAPEKSDLIPELKNDFFYIDNKMKINQFEVGATISYTFFNSVKRIKK